MSDLHFGMMDTHGVRDIGDRARHLEDLGYDYIGVGEHYMRGNPPQPSTAALPPLAVAAGATRRLRVVPSILLLPLYHPTLLAKQISSFDIACGGRITVGIGVGGEFPMEFEALEVPTTGRGARANEILALLRRLWNEEHVSHDGQFFHLNDVTLNPPPLQKPHPPIWVAGRREAAMRRAVRYGDGWFPYLYSPRRYRSSVERVQELAAAEGRDLTGFQWALHVQIAIYDTEEKAAQTAASFLGGRYQADTDFINMVRNFCALGPADACAQRLQEYVAAGARHFMLALACPPEDATRHIETIAQEVVPGLRP